MDRLPENGHLSEEDGAALAAAIIAASPLLSAATEDPELDGVIIGIWHTCTSGIAKDADFDTVVASLARQIENILILSEIFPPDWAKPERADGCRLFDGWVVQAMDAHREDCITLGDGVWGILPSQQGSLTFRLELKCIYTGGHKVKIDVVIGAGLGQSISGA